jgi:hypothetical protein
MHVFFGSRSSLAACSLFCVGGGSYANVIFQLFTAAAAVSFPSRSTTQFGCRQRRLLIKEQSMIVAKSVLGELAPWVLLIFRVFGVHRQYGKIENVGLLVCAPFFGL